MSSNKKDDIGKIFVSKGWYPPEFAVILDINYAWYKLKLMSNGSIVNLTHSELNKRFIQIDKSRRKDVL